MMLGLPLLQDIPTQTADKMFYKCFNTIRNRYFRRSLYLFLQGLVFTALLIYTKLDSQKHSIDVDPRIINSMLIVIAISSFGFLVIFIQYRSVYSRPAIYLAIADITNHLVPGQNVRSMESLEQCTSENIYLGEKMEWEEAVSQQKKKMLEKITIGSIIKTVNTRIRCARSSQSILSFLSIGTMINNTVVMVTTPVTVLDIVFFSGQVVFVMLTQLIFIAVLIAVAFLPLICCVFCICVCCCKRAVGNIIDVPETEATANDIMNAGGDCSICYQNIGVTEKIYVLPCSQKHLFHVNCLLTWVKVRPNCPICRHEIPMRVNP